MALALDDLGVEHGERVAIVSPNSGRFLTSYFGVSGYGRTLVPINFRLTADEIAYVVQHSGASVLLYDPDLADEVELHKGGAPLLPRRRRRRRAVRTRSRRRGAAGLGARRRTPPAR